MRKAGLDLLRLTAWGICGKQPDREAISGMDLEKLYQMCQFHSLTALVCMTLESSGIDVPSIWTEAKSKAIRKNILLDAERAKICGFLEQNGIWYMPLKGVILKELYPKLGMRQMADNDILYDRQFQKQLRDYMKQSGYTAESVGKTHHDTYMKPPVYNYEMHTILFDEYSPFYGYYQDIRQKMVKDPENDFGYHLRDADFYLYLIAHEYKHYSAGGTGIRSLLDRFVYLRAKQDDMDWEHIRRELKTLKLAAFEEKTRVLAEKIFSGENLEGLSEEEADMLEYYLFSGTYGTIQHTVENRIKKLGCDGKKVSKWRYLWRRMFPDMEFYKMYYPFFYRHKWLLPVGWLFRLCRGVTLRRKRVYGEMRVVMQPEEKKQEK